ncbi:hypothetical protein [Flavobacterium sp.]|uniref:hypothetical protein n=1 Tax=Flavobacterium sp. TaxID=239 RepID=UPI0040479E70
MKYLISILILLAVSNCKESNQCSACITELEKVKAENIKLKETINESSYPELEEKQKMMDTILTRINQRDSVINKIMNSTTRK